MTGIGKPARARAVVRVATHDGETVAAIHAALDARRPIALIHPKLTETEISRQRALVEQADLGGDDAVVLFTSGSTGSARGVVLSSAALEAAARASWQLLGVERGDRWWCPLSFAHAGGLSILVRCRVAGIEMTFDPTGATLASLVPTMLQDLGETLPATLRAVLLGGAAAPAGLVEKYVARGVPVLPTYGLTETFGQIATARVPGGPLVPLPGVEIRGGTAEVPERLRVRGPMLATRYLDGAAIAPEFATADLGYVAAADANADATLHIVGRADDVIITGGENVHPAQVEAVVSATPGVRGAVAFGVADARWGQIVAVAVEADGAIDTRGWHAALPPHARPRRLHVSAALPRLASGKLDRRAIATLPTQPIEYA